MCIYEHPRCCIVGNSYWCHSSIHPYIHSYIHICIHKYTCYFITFHKVLVDTNFINFSIKNKLEMYKSMMDCLLAKCIPCITDCVMAEVGEIISTLLHTNSRTFWPLLLYIHVNILAYLFSAPLYFSSFLHFIFYWCCWYVYIYIIAYITFIFTSMNYE